jgi:hypothetical protein
MDVERAKDAPAEDWLDVGVDIAYKTWVNGLEFIDPDELRALGKEQWTNPIPGHNAQIRKLQEKYPELSRKP